MKKRKRPELYSMPASTARREKADQAFWMHDVVLGILVVGLSALDAITLFTVFDTVMYQSQTVGVIVTLGCALALNFIPLVLARFIHLYRYHMSGVRLWSIALLAAAFLALFSATFYLRWETRDLSFTGMDGTMVDTTGQSEGIEATDSDSNEAVALTVLLGIMPAITSAINLGLGYINDDPIKRKLAKFRVEQARLDDQLSIMRAAAQELDQDWETYLRELDEAQFMDTCQIIRADSDQIRALARLLLAEKLGDPDSISTLTDTRPFPTDEAGSPEADIGDAPQTQKDFSAAA